MKKTPPVNLNLFTIKFPLPAISSILHRISGVILFLFIPVLLCALKYSLTSQGDFDELHNYMSNPIAKFFLWVLLASFIYHLIAGVRHLMMDLNIGVDIRTGKLTALITILLSGILAIIVGIWLW